MRWAVVAKKDFYDAVQSRSLWALTALLVVITVAIAYSLGATRMLAAVWPVYVSIFGSSKDLSELTTFTFIFFFSGPARVLVPVTGLIITYNSLSGEISSGRIKFLFSMPVTRWDVLVGKLVGRATVFSVALVSALVLAGGLVWVLTGRVQLVPFALITFFTLLFGIAYSSIGVNLSAMAKTESRAVVYAVSTYLFLLVVFQYVNNVIYFLLEGEIIPPPVGTSGPPDVGGWWYFLVRLTPGGAYQGLVQDMLGDGPRFAPVFETAEAIPFYLDTSFTLLVLLLWILAPVGVGYHVFSRSNIA